MYFPFISNSPKPSTKKLFQQRDITFQCTVKKGHDKVTFDKRYIILESTVNLICNDLLAFSLQKLKCNIH